MKHILILLIYFSISSLSFSQEEAETQPLIKTKHFVGLHAGSTTGIGFSYRYWPKRLGIQVTAFSSFDYDKEIWSSNGLSILYTLKETKHIDIFSYLGNHLTYEKWLSNQFDDVGNIISSTKVSRTRNNIGIGIGLKIDFLEDLDFNIQAGYGLYDITNDFNTLIAGEVGLYYHL